MTGDSRSIAYIFYLELVPMPSSFSTSAQIGAKIQVYPPIACTFAGIDGLLTQIDEQGMVVTLGGHGTPAKSVGSFYLGLESFLGKYIEAKIIGPWGDGWQLGPVNDEAQRALENLLTVLRKEQHIKICAEQNVEASTTTTGLEHFRLRPKALPELAWGDLDTRTSLLGQTFDFPLLITGMTGGVVQGADINRRLAMAASEFRIPMGVGSQRIALRDSRYRDIFQLKQSYPKLFLIGNLGVNQLKKGQELDDCRAAVEMIQADALALHVNVLQELIQEEGDRDFRFLLDRIATVAEHLSVPVVVKEVGCGFDVETVMALYERGVRCVDVGGQGGTSWAFIEGQRSASPTTRALGETFRNWGLPTALALTDLNKALPELDLIATGGIRDGLMVAKAVGLGAKTAGVGLPLFRAAVESETAVIEVLEMLARGLKTAMLCSGCQRLDQLGSRLVAEASLHTRLISHR